MSNLLDESDHSQRVHPPLKLALLEAPDYPRHLFPGFPPGQGDCRPLVNHRPGPDPAAEQNKSAKTSAGRGAFSTQGPSFLFQLNSLYIFREENVHSVSRKFFLRQTASYEKTSCVSGGFSINSSRAPSSSLGAENKKGHPMGGLFYSFGWNQPTLLSFSVMALFL